MIRNPTKLLTGCDVVFHQRIASLLHGGVRAPRTRTDLADRPAFQNLIHYRPVVSHNQTPLVTACPEVTRSPESPTGLLLDTHHGVTRYDRATRDDPHPNLQRFFNDQKGIWSSRTRANPTWVRTKKSPVESIEQRRLPAQTDANDLYLCGLSPASRLVRSRYSPTRVAALTDQPESLAFWRIPVPTLGTS